jgi:flagellar hook-associated protein 3 FlgL
MIGRISTLQFNNSGISTILEAQSQLARLQEQIGTGKRILSPADDPSAAAKLINLKSELSRLASEQKNIASITSALSFEESALNSANDLLQRVRELAVQGQNGTLADSDRNAISVEMDELRAQLLNLGNSRNAAGEYIFAGSATNAPAYSEDGTFQGDEVVRQINIGAGVRVAEGHTGVEVFEGVDDVLNTFAIIEQLSNAIRQNEAPALAERFDDLDQAIEQLSLVRTSVGSRMNWVDDQAALNENFNLGLNRTISEIEDLDIAEAIGRLQLQMVSLQAAQQTFVKTQNLSLFNYL